MIPETNGIDWNDVQNVMPEKLAPADMTLQSERVVSHLTQTEEPEIITQRKNRSGVKISVTSHDDIEVKQIKYAPSPAIEKAFNAVKAAILFPCSNMLLNINENDHNSIDVQIPNGLQKSATTGSFWKYLCTRHECNDVHDAIGTVLGIAGYPLIDALPPSIRVGNIGTYDEPSSDHLIKSVSTSCLSNLEKELDSNVVEIRDLVSDGVQTRVKKISFAVSEYFIDMSDEHLRQVLFSTFSLMGYDSFSTWFITPEAEMKEVSDTKILSVTLGQLMTYLQNVYQVSPSKISDVTEDIKDEQPPEFWLHLRIEEASDLRPKTVKGGTNPYVTARLSSSSSTQRTVSDRETLNPKWRQGLKLKLPNMRKDSIVLEVIHEYDAIVAESLKDVRDLGSVTRLITTTNAKALKHRTKLLGKVTIPLIGIITNDFDNWLPLQKDDPKEEAKHRGIIHIKAHIGTSADEESPSENRKKYDTLLTNLVHHSTVADKMVSEQPNFDSPFNGNLPPEALALLSHHAIVYNIKKPAQYLSWWLVGSHLPSADMSWQLARLEKVQSCLSEGEFNREDLEILADSFASWSKLCVHKLRNLQTFFPTSSGVIARHQLTCLLRIATSLQENSYTKKLLEQRSICDLKNKIKETVLEYVEVWWKSITNFRASVDLESQMKKVISFLFETEVFFKTVAGFYSPVFLKEAKIPFFREVFLRITKGIKQCVLPLLQNIDTKFSGHRDEDKNDVNSISVGPDLWQIYVNLRRVQYLGTDLPPEVQEESGIYHYHKWFEKGVLRWIEFSRRRMLSMLHKAVEFDSFQTDDEYHNFSSSATDTIGIFTEVQIWWKRLEWPDEVNSGVILAKILLDVCSCGTVYSELLKAKVDGTQDSDARPQHDVIISEQTCICLNNIEKVRQELFYLPDRFDVDKMADSIQVSTTGGEIAAVTFRNNIKEVIADSSSNMERKVVEFIETVIEKRTDRLLKLVLRACEEGYVGPLLNEVLDPSLQLLQQKLDKSNFKRLLRRLWDELIQIFEWVITKNFEDKRNTYFEVISTIIEATLKFFTPSNGLGLDREELKCQRYLDLTEQLELRRLPSEKLIEKYYNERYSEHIQPFNQQKAELVVKAYFTKIGKLKVEVIMARDMIATSDAGSVNSKQSYPAGSSHPVDSYVKVKLVPSAWFKDAAEKKTKVSWKSDPAVYDEELQFELAHGDNGVSNGFLLMTLKDYNLAKGNKFIGESILPLRDLICVDSADVGAVPLTRLKMTVPGFEIGYKPLAILKLRTNDSTAKQFVKKVAKRLPDGGRKHGFFSGSSDEEKPRHRSPGFLNRRKIS